MAVQADEAAPVVPVARRKRRGQFGLVGVLAMAGAAAAALYLVLAPLLALLATAFRGPSDLLPFEAGAHWTFDNLIEVYVNTPLLSNVLPSTAIFVLGSVAVTFFAAFTLAWLVERTDLPWRTAIFTLVLFPLLVPGVVMAFAWTLLFAPNAGWVNVALRGVLDLDSPGPINIFSMGGLILCQGIASVPFVFLLLGAAMRTMNPALEEASSASGARPLTTFFRVTLPVLRPGVLAPLILATLVALEQFEMPLIIGFPARINVFSTRLYFDLNPEDELPAYGKAAAVALLFLAAAVAPAHRLQSPDPARRTLRDGDRQGLPPNALCARQVARAGAAVRRRLSCCRRHPAGASCWSGRASPAAAAKAMSLDGLSASARRPALLASGGQHLPGRRPQRRHHHPDRRVARLADPPAALSGPPAARCRELHVDRHPGGDHRLRGDGPPSHAPDRPLRHGRGSWCSPIPIASPSRPACRAHR